VLTDAPGLHHVTGIVGDAQQAVAFYAGTLGLRLAQQTVNFEDLLQHHLYFADAAGEPGSVLTVFPDPYADDGRVGRPQPERTALAVPEGSLSAWRERLAAAGVAVEPVERFVASERALQFTDPVGTRLELVASDAPGAPDADPYTARVDASMAVRGLHGVTLQSGNPYATASVLETLGYEYEVETTERVRYRAAGDRATVVDLLLGDAEGGREGPGTYHHVAVRVPEEEALYEWRDLFTERGYECSRVKDRHYFHSLYVREPGGILFELATETGGIAAGAGDATALSLPEWFESERELVESQLPALSVPAVERP
jgi:glyoxalase family protein